MISDKQISDLGQMVVSGAVGLLVIYGAIRAGRLTDEEMAARADREAKEAAGREHPRSADAPASKGLLETIGDILGGIVGLLFGLAVLFGGLFFFVKLLKWMWNF